MRVDFESAVLKRSHTVPVVVDFWAAWCGPCRVLGPIIEELAAGASGRWELVKLDTEAQPELAAEYGIRGIPAVKMFHAGRVIAEFVGALPREEIRRWLEASLPDERLERLESLAGRWPREGGRAIAAELERFVESHPDLAAGRLRLAQAVVADDPARARALLRGVAADPEHGELPADLEALVELVEHDGSGSARFGAALAGAREALATHDLEAAFERLVDAASADRAAADGLARRAAVALFHLLGQEHELTREYQRRLAAALFS